MVTIATRASWGARHKNGDLGLSGLASEVFLHHTVTAQLPANATVEQEREQMRAIEGIGQSRFGTGISYNILIFPSGRAYQGVSWNRRGTHTRNRNSTARSICFAGNTDVNQPTAAQIAAARAIFHHGRGRWWTAGAPLRAHRDVAATACPGRHAVARMADIRRAPATGSGTGSNTGSTVGSTANRVAVTGRWDAETTRWLQRTLGTPVQGFVSGQPDNLQRTNPGLTSFRWVPRARAQGSQLILAMQRAMGRAYTGAHDGLAGPIFMRALQTRRGTQVTGTVSNPSQLITAMQRQINATGRWW